MAPTSELLVDLVHALLANARGLAADARLLNGHGRHARSYALAALAGEELGKVEVCLDWLLGAPTRSEKQFRRAWQNHAEKLASLTAYGAAFIDDPGTVRLDNLKDQVHEIASRKMAAFYVDFDDAGITTPASITEAEATDLLVRVEAAVEHATKALGRVTSEVVAVTNDLAPQLLVPLSSYFEALEPGDAIEGLRRLLARMASIDARDWALALHEDRIAELLAL